MQLFFENFISASRKSILKTESCELNKQASENQLAESPTHTHHHSHNQNPEQNRTGCGFDGDEFAEDETTTVQVKTNILNKTILK